MVRARLPVVEREAVGRTLRCLCDALEAQARVVLAHQLVASAGLELADELARKDVLSYTRLKGVTFWKITDLYKDTYYFNYVVDEFVRETRRHGCSWVAAPAPRALPILGAVGLKARLPACYIHKQGELPVRPNA